MRTVIYTHDMEPITVIELKHWQFEFLNRHGRIVLAVQPEFEIRAAELDESIPVSLPYVEITAEWLHRGSQSRMLLFTRNEEPAMLLDSEFLPGQRRELRQREREAFGRGIIAAISAWR